MSLKKKECNHDTHLIATDDVLRTHCKKCDKYFETNPYTGKISEITKQICFSIICR